jgi:hypothetical protein
MKRALIAVFAVLFSLPAAAQTVANGPYYAVPSWDQTLPTAQRFIVLANMNQEAVLDRETGLVWQRTPLGTTNSSRSVASTNCHTVTTGGRQGWRLPRVDELMTLADPSNTDPDQVHLPTGHPFLTVTAGNVFWAADHIPAPLTDGGIIVFFSGGVAGAGINHVNTFQFTGARAWCVRGMAGNGANAR